jgi:nucleotide-binding universal stress UspA family protein
VGAHLARHGLNVEVKRVLLGDIDVADALLSHAADEGVDFIVMGGYSTRDCANLCWAASPAASWSQ